MKKKKESYEMVQKKLIGDVLSNSFLFFSRFALLRKKKGCALFRFVFSIVIILSVVLAYPNISFHFLNPRFGFKFHLLKKKDFKKYI